MKPGWKFPFLLVVFWLLCPLALACANPLEHELFFARDGKNIILALEIRPIDGYYAYAHTPGGTGLPTSLALSIPEFPDISPHIFYPKGAKKQDIFDSSASVNVYEHRAILFALLPDKCVGKPYIGELTLLLCSARQCLPVTIPLSGTIPQRLPPVDTTDWFQEWDTHKVIDESGEPPIQFAPHFVLDSLEVQSVWQALVMGLLAGLLLNIMPCVLPVITLKICLLLAGNEQSDNNVRSLRIQQLSFSLGILSFFSLLAILIGASGALWGQLFQSQLAILALLFIVFALALSMFGIYSLPVIDLKLDSRVTHPYIRAYCTGILATLLATPCSGPFLGGVLAWSHGQPWPVLLIVFWAIGLGMSLPYLLLAVCPNSGRFFPRPGPWLTIVEKIFAFLLLASAIYLLSILPSSLHVRILSLLLPLSLLLWLYGRSCTLANSNTKRYMYAFLCLCMFIGGPFWTIQNPSRDFAWQEYSPATFERLLGKQALLVQFTADWCPNCKFLEKTVLTPQDMQRWQQDYGMVAIKVDITASSAPGLDLLKQLGSRSIPLTALFSRGEDAAHPLVLRDIYGKERLEQALHQAFGGKQLAP